MNLHEILQRYSVFPVSEGSKVPPRDLDWTDLKNHVREVIPNHRNYGWPMSANGLAAIDMDPVGHADGTVKTTAELADIWRLFCGRLGFPYSDPVTISQSGGLHYVFQVQPGQNIGGARLKNLPPELEPFSQFIDFRYNAYLVTPESFIRHPDGRLTWYKPVAGSRIPPFPPQLVAHCQGSTNSAATQGNLSMLSSYIPELDTDRAIDAFRGYCAKNAHLIATGTTHNTFVSAILYGRDLGLSLSKVYEIVLTDMNNHQNASNPREPGVGDVNTHLASLVQDVYPRGDVRAIGLRHPDLDAIKVLNPVTYQQLTSEPQYTLAEGQAFSGEPKQATPLNAEAHEMGKTMQVAAVAATTRDMAGVNMDGANWQDEALIPLIDGVCYQGHITVVSGRAGSMKTTALVGMCAAGAATSDLEDFKGIFHPKLLPIYFAYEGGANIGAGFRATAITRNVAKPETDRFWVFKHPVPLVKAEAGMVTVDEAMFLLLERKVNELVAQHPGAAPMLILDSLTAITNDLNNKLLASMFMNRLRQAITRTGAGAVIVTHPPKMVNKADPLKVSGAGEYAQLADIVYNVVEAQVLDDKSASVVWSPSKDRTSAMLHDLHIELLTAEIIGRKKLEFVHGKIEKPGFRARRAQQASVLGLSDMDFVSRDVSAADQDVREGLSGTLTDPSFKPNLSEENIPAWTPPTVTPQFGA